MSAEWPIAAVVLALPKAGRMQGLADLADAAARRRARGCSLAMSDDDAGFIGIG